MGSLDSLNSTSTTLSAHSTFDGSWFNVIQYSSMTLIINSDVISANNGIVLEWSSDGSNIDYTIYYKYTDINVGQIYSEVHSARWFRIRYINNSTLQTYFRMQVIHHISKNKETHNSLRSCYESKMNSNISNIGGIDTINGNVTNSATSITINNGLRFPFSGTVKIISDNGIEYIIYRSKTLNTLTECIRGAFATTALSHADTSFICGVYIGLSEKSDKPDVLCSIKSDVSGTLFFDFSGDSINWDTFPTTGFTITANVHEFHTAVKGNRYFRTRFENGTTSATTSFRAYVEFGQFRQGNLPLNQTITSDADSILTRSVITGLQPDNNYVAFPADGSVFSTSSLLSAGGVYTSSWKDTNGWNLIKLFIKTDVVSAFNGINIQYTDNTQAETPTIQATDKYTFSGDDVTLGYKFIKVLTTLDGFRVVYTNGSSNQSTFFLNASLKTNEAGNTYNKGGALNIINFNTDVALGNISNYSIDTKYGRNEDVDTGAAEDIWNNGGNYTGQPLAFTPETVTVVSSSTNDTSAGTGARTVRIAGLKSSSSTDYESEDITLNGTTNVVSVNTWWRVFRLFVLTAGSGGSNAGIITVNSTTSTENVFASIAIGDNQTMVCAITVPQNKKMLIQRVMCNVGITGKTSVTARLSLRVRSTGGVFRMRTNYDIQDGMMMLDQPVGGYLITAGSDVKMRVESVSANNTIANATFEYVLQNI